MTRTLCDVCESAAAILFCAVDEAALCRACDDKVHMCNKLANRHVRVGLNELSEVPRCDICENAPAFFYCEIDGSSLCLQCDMIVHIGVKRAHRRYLLLRQRVEFPGDKPGSLEEPGSQKGHLGDAKREPTNMSDLREKENLQNHRLSPIGNNADVDEKMEDKLIDLNARPQRLYDRAPSNQERMDTLVDNNHASENVVSDGYFKREPEK